MIVDRHNQLEAPTLGRNSNVAQQIALSEPSETFNGWH